MFWMRTAGRDGTGNEGAMLFDRRTSTGTVIVLKNDGSILCSAGPGGANSFSAGCRGRRPMAPCRGHLRPVGRPGALRSSLTVCPRASNPNYSAWAWPVGQQIELGTIPRRLLETLRRGHGRRPHLRPDARRRRHRANRGGRRLGRPRRHRHRSPGADVQHQRLRLCPGAVRGQRPRGSLAIVPGHEIRRWLCRLDQRRRSGACQRPRQSCLGFQRHQHAFQRRLPKVS